MPRPVYSTGIGRTCPHCGRGVAVCRCKAARRDALPQKLRITLEKKGRRGKAVTVIVGLPLDESELAAAAKELKARCGTGGRAKDGTIELQGDRVEMVRMWVSEQGMG